MDDNINVDMNNKTEDVENSDESDNVKETLEDVVLRSWGNSSNSRSNLHALLVREQTGGKRYWPLRYDILRLLSSFKFKNNPQRTPICVNGNVHDILCKMSSPNAEMSHIYH